jgi:Icc-related predicted phosphoesterase
MKILAVSDVELGYIYQPRIAERFSDIDIIVSCGDLPHYYLEYIVSMLNVPLYYVNGNHATKLEITTAGDRSYPWGAINIHRKVKTDESGLLIGGIEGCLKYNNGPYQYSQNEMWNMVFKLVPKMLLNKVRFNRFLDVFISHAAPFGIHDQDDLPHTGIKAFNWLSQVFQPAYHLHGHVHVYRNDIVTQTTLNRTTILNCYGYKEIHLDMNAVLAAAKLR